ncbi:malate dehydrogenase (quinone) [Niabella ginsengisoli]|uniref:Probable malate:quinone oxidoreductase n=1 Tax=Niabella ginsengisoli TaxID=522298 RepID=A0ABS9SF20_9BACT|nr:malate dehydrogenase (quinone) [Niabella ginsengisoli]MCH5596958.1 malate dehydrogenase (quinone) [Niabella ginsengisoli]
MKEIIETDVVLIGGGIMSATLGMLINQLAPDKSIHIFERLKDVAEEASDAWNNAGTGHAALCELNYTPEDANGVVHTDKARAIMEQFEVSKQFWSYLIEQERLANPKDFIRSTPHMSFVRGEKDVTYLNKRFKALQESNLFQEMQYSEDHDVIKQWTPLIVEGREASEKIAATYSTQGTDVNFGAITGALINSLQNTGGAQLHLHHEVRKLKQLSDKRWRIKVKDLSSGKKYEVLAKFVFIGAGGGSLELLQKADIPEGKKYGGFPVGGQWLVCKDQQISAQHNAKVYGQAEVGAPPMSVPHLDARIIDGEKAILFGPFATFSTKFLKEGSYWDLFGTVKYWNIFPLIKVGIKNIDLEKYLIKQLSLSFEDRLEVLKQFYPEAKKSDWKLQEAGQRVQVIHNDPDNGPTLQFGTEIVTSADGSISALLGASPGASTAVSIMLKLLYQCFPDRAEANMDRLKNMIPSYGQNLEENPELLAAVRERSSRILELTA